MPRYEYRCANQHTTQRVCSVREHDSVISCPACSLVAQQIITAPVLVTAQPDIGYDSPIDGAHITSWQARREDLKRHECVEYDPGMKQDAARRERESEQALERSVETHIESTIAKMPTKQRAALYSELTEQGKTAEIVRS